GTRGFAGDGGPGISAQLDLGIGGGVALDRSGNIYILDSENQRVRKVTSDGSIRSVAGDGTAGFSGDGGPASAAKLNNPSGISVSPEGDIYIADSRNNRVRKITNDGRIQTFAGSGNSGFSGDGGPAISAQLYQPHGVDVDSRGNIYIADFSNGRIRKV